LDFRLVMVVIHFRWRDNKIVDFYQGTITEILSFSAKWWKIFTKKVIAIIGTHGLLRGAELSSLLFNKTRFLTDSQGNTIFQVEVFSKFKVSLCTLKWRQWITGKKKKGPKAGSYFQVTDPTLVTIIREYVSYFNDHVQQIINFHGHHNLIFIYRIIFKKIGFSNISRLTKSQNF
jgi:hypothetical protein